jgi:NAD(P)-dependent dehydrogenase (short-subunit alcohol dehydrogenase family)
MQEILDTFHPGLFAGRHVIVSGGSSGIGLSIAQGFARLGARVTATGSSEDKIAARQRDAQPGDPRFARLDVRDAEAVGRFMAEAGAIDVLVNGQGIARPGDEWDEATFAEVLDVNLTSAFRLTMAALPALKASRGAVVNVASMLSYLADAEVPSYTASKTGVLGLTRAMAHRFGPDGVRVNAIAPGYHRTDMTRALWSNPPDAERIAARSALRRWGTVDDLVGAAVFLCSPAAAFITGVALPVDGGFHTG